MRLPFAMIHLLGTAFSFAHGETTFSYSAPTARNAEIPQPHPRDRYTEFTMLPYRDTFPIIIYT